MRRLMASLRRGRLGIFTERSVYGCWMSWESVLLRLAQIALICYKMKPYELLIIVLQELERSEWIFMID